MPVEFKDYYTILGIPRDATEGDIKKAYRKLARRFHPDVAKDKKVAEEKFKQINEANEVLSDPAKRKKYDELGSHWEELSRGKPAPGSGNYEHWGRPSSGTSRQPFEESGFSDFFEQFFGGEHRGEAFDGRSRPGANRFTEEMKGRRGSDMEGKILVTMEEVMRGAVRTVSLDRADPVTGDLREHRFKVRIPPGVLEGQVIRVAGKGEEGHGGATGGDLFLKVRLASHPDFKVRGADLHRDLKLAPWSAVLGENVSVPTLDGMVTLRIPPGTQNGQVLRVRGRGLLSGPKGVRGDLHVTIAIVLPSRLTEDERVLWEKLKKGSRFTPGES